MRKKDRGSNLLKKFVARLKAEMQHHRIDENDSQAVWDWLDLFYPPVLSSQVLSPFSLVRVRDEAEAVAPAKASASDRTQRR